MIKPFTILETRTEADGSFGVFYRVELRVVESVMPRKVVLKQLEGYATVPKDADIDAYIYQYLKDSGWVE